MVKSLISPDGAIMTLLEEDTDGLMTAYYNIFHEPALVFVKFLNDALLSERACDEVSGLTNPSDLTIMHPAYPAVSIHLITTGPKICKSICKGRIMGSELFIGIDVGSITIKTAVLDGDQRLLAESYVRIKGDPLSTLHAELEALSSRFGESSIRTAGITGSGGKQVAGSIGALFINEILAQSAFARCSTPGPGPSSRWAARTPSSSPWDRSRAAGSRSRISP
jgi:hypothetical protein